MKKRTKAFLVVLALPASYAVAYLGNSLAGGYWLLPVRDGKHLWELTGFSIHDAVQWQPRFGYVEKYERDTVGTLFYPLIRIDQKYWHQTLYMTSERDFHRVVRDMPSSDVHPQFREDHRRLKTEPRSGAPTLANDEMPSAHPRPSA